MNAWLIFLLVDLILFIATPGHFYPKKAWVSFLPGSGVYVFSRALLNRTQRI